MNKMRESPSDSGGALVACSLWLHIGLIGATTLAAGLLQGFDGDSRLPWSPIVALFGGALAAASWRRGFAVLEQAEHPSAVAPNASSESTSRVPPSDMTLRERPVVRCAAAVER
jgi:hypothetical protein